MEKTLNHCLGVSNLHIMNIIDDWVDLIRMMQTGKANEKHIKLYSEGKILDQ